MRSPAPACALALAAAALASLAGCAEAGAEPREPGFQAVLLSGDVRGSGPGREGEDEPCDAALAYRADYEARTLAYVAGSVELAPSHTEAVVFLDGTFSHPAPQPCFPFQRLTSQDEGFHAAVLAAPPFRLEVPFTLEDGGAVRAAGRLLPPGGAVDLAVDQVDGGIHYRGHVQLRNLGQWPFSGARAVASVDPP